MRYESEVRRERFSKKEERDEPLGVLFPAPPPSFGWELELGD